jgi:hypothetical protein
MDNLFPVCFAAQSDYVYRRICNRQKREGFNQGYQYLKGSLEEISASKNKHFIDGVVLVKTIHDELKVKLAVRFG